METTPLGAPAARSTPRLAWFAVLLVLLTLAAPSVASAAGTWTALANTAPAAVQNLLLLSDGTVMAQNSGGSAWYKLTPNASGSYANGTWTSLAAMGFTRRYYASQLLQNGKVMIAGGEYGSGGATTELYDPVANSWTQITVPAGLVCACPQGDGSNGAFRDPDSILLPNGNMMVAPVFPALANRTVIYSPAANTWSNGPAYLGNQNEASWVKLPDDSILTIDTSSQLSERFIPSLNRWIRDANVPVALYGIGAELGAALLLPDGRAFFIGGTGATVFYTPSGTTNFGTWATGPSLPNGQAAPDAPAANLINGKVLLAVSAPIYFDGTNNVFPSPTSYYEYDPVGNAYTRINAPGGGLTRNYPCYQTTMLALPDGNVLYSDWSSQLYIYQPGGSPVAAGKPTINSININGDGSYHLTGTKLNGISAGAAYGDDLQMDSNYPLVRLSSGANVYYARTYNWSSTSVMTGNAVLSTEFTLPPFLSPGSYSLVVVANGIASDPIFFEGPVWVDFNYGGFFHFGTFTFPYSTLGSGVGAVASGGTIMIKPGASTEIMTITKPMRINAAGGPATIGVGH